MTLRLIFWAGIITLVLGAGWRYADPELKKSLLQTPAETYKPFKFDNGSRRDDSARSSVADHPSRHAAVEAAPGSLRKCARAGQVVYTNMPCPQDYRVSQVKGGTVNVVEGQDLALNERSDPRSSPSASAHRNLREALDLNAGPHLQAQVMERAIEAER